MIDAGSVLRRYKNLAGTLGRAAVSSFYPNDMEYYLCAFELVNSSGTEAYFVFPIQPSAITKSEPSRVNIKKSLSGITVLRNDSFIPQELNIKGNFGRRFKLLSNLEGVAFTSINSGVRGIEFDTPVLSQSIKTGYGATKLLQKLLQEANNIDRNGRPKQLYFYNMGFGESYLVSVSPSGMSFSQSEDRNMIWMYNVNMTILAPLSSIAAVDNVETNNRKIVSRGAVGKIVNTVASDVRRFLL